MLRIRGTTRIEILRGTARTDTPWEPDVLHLGDRLYLARDLRDGGLLNLGGIDSGLLSGEVELI